MGVIKERPRVRQSLLKFCREKNISLIDLYTDYPCGGNLRKQLKLMLLETDQLDLAKEKKAEKMRE